MTKRLLLLCWLALTVLGVNAQYYSGEHVFDGEHDNEVSASVTTGKNILVGAYGGTTLHYKHYFNNHWSVDAGLNAQLKKRLYGVKATGEYHLQLKAFHMFASSTVLYNRYDLYNTNEWDINFAVRFERGYWDITLGESWISYVRKESGYTEPLTLTFAAHASLRPRTHRWNVGLLFRNFDDFYYENWNINWGLDGYYKINPNVKLFAEFNVRPAGSMSQLATKYEASGKIGVIYKWNQQ